MIITDMYKAAVTTKNADRLRREIKHLFNSKYGNLQLDATFNNKMSYSLLDQSLVINYMGI